MFRAGIDVRIRSSVPIVSIELNTVLLGVNVYSSSTVVFNGTPALVRDEYDGADLGDDRDDEHDGHRHEHREPDQLPNWTPLRQQRRGLRVPNCVVNDMHYETCIALFSVSLLTILTELKQLT